MTEHVPLAFSVHEVVLNWLVDPVSVLHVTVPDGVVVPPPVTVTRHVLGALMGSGLGEHVILV